MLKPFSFVFFVLVMIWLGGIFLTTQPQVRMDRACSPVHITGVAAEAAMTLVNEDVGQQTKKAFDIGTFACKHIVWSIFYREDWMKAQQLQQEIESRSHDSRSTDERDPDGRTPGRDPARDTDSRDASTPRRTGARGEGSTDGAEAARHARTLGGPK